MSAAPVYRPPEVRRPRAASALSETRRSSSSASRMASGVALFAFVAFTSYGFFALLGQSMKEHARRESLRSAERARAARADVGRLRERVSHLRRLKALDQWAASNGLVSPYDFSRPPAVLTQPVSPVDTSMVALAKPRVDVVVAALPEASNAQ